METARQTILTAIRILHLGFDILPALKDGDSSFETAMPRRENVLSRIDIAVVALTTRPADPFSYSKSCPTLRTTAAYTAAARAGLGSVRFIYDFKNHTSRNRFILDLIF